MKFNEGKYRPSLIYSSLLKEISKVRQYGAEKHGGYETWETTKPIQHFDAAMRHICAFVEGEINDTESGLGHLAHAASNIMFEIERRYREEPGDTPVHGVAPSSLSCLDFAETEVLVLARELDKIKQEEENEQNSIWTRL